MRFQGVRGLVRRNSSFPEGSMYSNRIYIGLKVVPI